MSDVAVLTAVGVGGGSLIYANVQLPAPADVFDDGWPAASRESRSIPTTGLLEVARGLNMITGWRRRLLRLNDMAARAGISDLAVKPRDVRLDHGSRRPITDSLVFLMIGRDPGPGAHAADAPLRRLDVR